MSIQQKEKGFTIIEVVLVLAIAGLIFMMVFIALPSLQRSQRDTQRKNDLSRVMTAITSYSSNNRGNVPAAVVATLNTFKSSYLTVSGDSFMDPSGANSVNRNSVTYDWNTANATGALNAGFTTATQNTIYYAVGFTCDPAGSGNALLNAGSRKVTVRMYLEGGGVACQNN